MKIKYFFLLFFIFYMHTVLSQDYIKDESNTISFYAIDSVLITADTYFIKEAEPSILLCHQAGFSRGEYLETAKKLNKLGFSCMAIDQRSGKEVNGIINLTAVDANSKQMNVGYSGAKKDMEAAIDYLYNINGNKPIILIGSSYSASLALWIATENNKIKAVAAFSPGEYLKNLNLTETLKNLNTPTFVTSSKREISPVTKLVRFVNKDNLIQFKPTVTGIHGSRAIWESTEGYKEYWNAFKAFLLANK